MKILIIGNRKHQFIYNYVAALKKNNHNKNIEVDILSQDINNSKNDMDIVYNHIYSMYNSSRILKIKLFRIIYQLILLSYYACRLNNYDIVHIHFIENIIIWNSFFSKKIKGKLIVTIWGSDFLRANKNKRNRMRHVFDRADQITIATPSVIQQFNDFYNGIYNEKISICQFGLKPLENIKKFLFNKEGNISNHFAPSDKITVTIGYNATILQRHKEIIECIESCKELCIYKNKIEFLLPCTYPKNKEYLDELKKLTSKCNFHYSILTDFMSDDEVAKLRISSNIFIQLQPTDMLSGSMLEHLATGNIVITGSWLPYELLDNMGVYMRKIDKVNQVAKELYIVLENYKEYFGKCSLNKKIVLNNFQWESVIDKWLGVYEKVLN